MSSVAPLAFPLAFRWLSPEHAAFGRLPTVCGSPPPPGSVRSGQASSSSWLSLPRLMTSVLGWGCVLMLTSSPGHDSPWENTRRTGRCTTSFGESVAMETTPRLRSITAPTLVRKSAPRRTGYAKSSITANSWENPPGETVRRVVPVHVRGWLFAAYNEGAVSVTLIAAPARSTTGGETIDTSAPVSITQSTMETPSRVRLHRGNLDGGPTVCWPSSLVLITGAVPEVHGSKWLTSTSITLILPCAGGAVDIVLADVDGVGGRAGGNGQCSTRWPSWSHRKHRPRNRHGPRLESWPLDRHDVRSGGCSWSGRLVHQKLKYLSLLDDQLLQNCGRLVNRCILYRPMGVTAHGMNQPSFLPRQSLASSQNHALTFLRAFNGLRKTLGFITLNFRLKILAKPFQKPANWRHSRKLCPLYTLQLSEGVSTTLAKKKNHHQDSRREERCSTCDIMLDQARSAQGKSRGQSRIELALRWSRLIEHDITCETAFFSPRISMMVLFFGQGSKSRRKHPYALVSLLLHSHELPIPIRNRANRTKPVSK